MKLKSTAGPPVQNIDLYEPRVEGSKIYYTWSQNPLLDEKGLWLEYPGINIDPSPTAELMAPYLPICLAFAVLGNISIRLPYRLPDDLFEQWKKIIRDTARAVYRKKKGCRLVNGSRPLQTISWKGQKTALLFGGGAEALLTLAYLMRDGIKPILVSFEGQRWDGADPEKNPHKSDLEKKLAQEFELELVKIRTPFFKLIYQPAWDWHEYLKRPITGIINAALFQPFIVTGMLPVARTLNIDIITNGIEKDNEKSNTTYCFSSQSIKNLARPSTHVTFRAYLQDMIKAEITKDLHQNFSKVAKYQYSCLVNKNERWCLHCEKCFRCLLSLVISDVPLSCVGVEKVAFQKNLPVMIHAARSALCKKPTLMKEYYRGYLEKARKANSPESERMIQAVLKHVSWMVLKNRIGAVLRPQR